MSKPFKPVKDGKNPHKRETKVDVQFRNGAISKHALSAGSWRWTDTGHDFDVVASRVAAS
jgi:hypothetical protein